MTVPQMTHVPVDGVECVRVHASAATQEWWREAVIYQVYPRSFADSDGDGVGDLPGITARLDHLAALGVDALWLSPFYPSPLADGGYDVADYCDVDPRLGRLEDFDDLLARAHALDLRVIVDLVPNHTSDQHAWFRAALAASDGSPDRDRYIFRRGRGASGAEPPNNWQSLFGGPAWSRVDERTGNPDDHGLWYLHMFDSSQPDLDWSNGQVREDFEGILRFWLDRGVDGFRVDVAHGMVKQDGLPDWGGSAAMVTGVDDGDPQPAVGAAPMFDQDGVHDIYRAWNRLLAGYPGERILVAEAWVEPLERIARYVRPGEMQQAFNFTFMTAPWDSAAMRAVVAESLRVNDSVGAPTTWVLSNHDVVRHASLLGLRDTSRSPNGIGPDDEQPDAKLGLRRARAAVLLMLALPGSAYLYQGEELGLPEHTTLNDSLRQDPAWERSGRTQRGRDGCRVPLPWLAEAPGYGFSATGATWLPQPDDWAPYAVDVQERAADSTLQLYRAALRLRRRYGLGSGDLAWVGGLPGQAPDVLALSNGGLLSLTNFGSDAAPLPYGHEVLLSSCEVDAPDGGATVPPNSTVWLRGR
jgi:alpha-glucosidase